MKNYRNLTLIVIVIALFVLPGCNPVDRYDEMYKMVQKAATAKANYDACYDSEFGKVQAVTQQANAYYAAQGHAVDAWAARFKDEKDAAAQAIETSKASTGTDQDPAKNVDLAKMQEDKLTPGDMTTTFTTYVNAITESQPPVVDSAVTLALMDTTSEAMNSLRGCAFNWNTTVEEYNTLRGQVGNQIVERISSALGYPLPLTLPRYQGSNSGAPIGNPIEPTKPQ